MRIVLASQSQNRHTILEKIGVSHTIIPAHIDEYSITGSSPTKRAIKIATQKAKTVAQKRIPPSLIIAADTFALYRNKTIEKPKFKMDALDILKSLSGTSHQMITGWCVFNTKTKNEYTGHSTTRIFFRPIDTTELTDYVNDHQVTQWAAGYSPQDTIAISFVDRIEGSLTGFMYGLPLEQIMPVLSQETD